LTLIALTYSEAFKDHLANPRNAGELANANAVGEETNPVCGDRLRLYLQVKAGRIEAARFLAYGCPPTLVCGSILTELIKGRSVEEATRLTRKDLLAALGGLPSRKQHAAALAIETLRAAIASV
jgi:nitrogen fixation NifU-like protein